MKDDFKAFKEIINRKSFKEMNNPITQKSLKRNASFNGNKSKSKIFFFCIKYFYLENYFLMKVYPIKFIRIIVSF